MSELCLDCWNKIMKTNDPPKKFIMSREKDLCEECGEYQRVIIRLRTRYILKELLDECLENLRNCR